MKPLIKILLLISIAYSISINAEIYKWVDAHGNISYSDEKPEGQATQTVIIKEQNHTEPQNNVKKNKVTKFIPLFGNTESYKSKRSSSSKKLIMYSASWCGYCKKARNYFTKNRIRFTEYDIEKNLTAKRIYDKLGGSGIPLIVSGTKQMQGFNVAKFKKFYKN